MGFALTGIAYFLTAELTLLTRAQTVLASKISDTGHEFAGFEINKFLESVFLSAF